MIKRARINISICFDIYLLDWDSWFGRKKWCAWLDHNPTGDVSERRQERERSNILHELNVLTQYHSYQRERRFVDQDDDGDDVRSCRWWSVSPIHYLLALWQKFVQRNELERWDKFRSRMEWSIRWLITQWMMIYVMILEVNCIAIEIISREIIRWDIWRKERERWISSSIKQMIKLYHKHDSSFSTSDWHRRSWVLDLDRIRYRTVHVEETSLRIHRSPWNVAGHEDHNVLHQQSLLINREKFRWAWNRSKELHYF